MKIRAEVFEVLARSDTPTVCNAIELAQGKRGFDAFTQGRYFPMHASARVAMGFARTAKIASANPPAGNPADAKKLRMQYYEYVAQGPRPAITVIEDTDPEPVGAFWGEVNTNVHRGLGISGVLTNGAIRDFGCCPEDFQVIGGAVAPSHAFVHVTEVGCAVNVFGMEVADGDFVHADRHGGCVIPADILPDIDTWIEKHIALEDIVLTAAKREDFDFEKLAEAWAAFEKKRV